MGPVAGLTVSGQNELNRGWQLMDVQGPALLTGGRFGMEGGLIVTLTTAIATGRGMCFGKPSRTGSLLAQFTFTTGPKSSRRPVNEKDVSTLADPATKRKFFESSFAYKSEGED
jgi:hypothetical protein